jgi:predicted ester cyclase
MSDQPLDQPDHSIDSVQNNKHLVQRYYDEVLGGQPEVADEIFGPEHQHAPWNGTRGPESVKDYVAVLLVILPDVQVEVQHLIAEGDLVVADVLLTGTHQGELLHIPATGKQITTREMCFFRVQEGRIVARWYIFDGVEAMQQLGGIVQPPQKEQI